MIHGQFQQKPKLHLQGHGCTECGGYRNTPYTAEEFIKKANQIHENKYKYSNVNYINNYTHIIITCPNHGDFKQIPTDHMKRFGCKKCNLCPKCQIWRTLGKICKYCKHTQNKILHQKTKELAVVKFLKNALPDHEFIHNKSVGKDCTDGHLFPDIRFDCIHYHLIVEVDENKHRGSQYECDEQRMRDIIAKLGQPCIFIRYNPDNKVSDKNTLLDTIGEHIDLDESSTKDIFDDYGLRCIYLFY